MALDPERMFQLLLDYGWQYYTAGRYARFAEQQPVYANLLHHAVEMFLKALLARRGYSSQQLKELDHDLDEIWEEFKKNTNDPKLRGFDKTIRKLDEFEEIRYPDHIVKHGAILSAPIDKAAARSGRIKTPSGKEPRRSIDLESVDALVAAIHKASSANPAFFAQGRMMNRHAAKYLRRDNKSAGVLSLSPATD